jgi:hypothetical protein
LDIINETTLSADVDDILKQRFLIQKKRGIFLFNI